MKTLHRLILTLLITNSALALPPSGKSYSTPENAVEALQAALLSNNSKQLDQVFGASAAEILRSDDPAADQAGIKKFLDLYNEKHAIYIRDGRVATLLVGNVDWPFPIPLIRTNTSWSFDANQGKEEIIDRRIGRNEISAIHVCEAYVDIQNEYHSKDRNNDGVLEYAQTFMSKSGEKNGLFWPRKLGEEASPMGPLLADAAVDGYEFNGKTPRPYFGYMFRILTSQGPAAKGGKKNYIDSQGKMTGGYALVAYPLVWGDTGIMTFIVDKEGVVYQKNMGKGTLTSVAKLKEFNPDKSWQKVTE